MPEPPTSIEKPPNEILANAILAKLMAEDLIPESKHAEVAAKLAKGTATQQDWTTWLDVPLTKKEGIE